MSLDEVSAIKPLLKDYVEKSSKSVELQWDPKITTFQLPFDPYATSEKERCAHYFLQIAAIDTAELVLRSENKCELTMNEMPYCLASMGHEDMPTRFQKELRHAVNLRLSRNI